MKVLSENPKIIFNEPEIFVNHSLNNRSGHLGHAMVECKDGTIIAFYANTSGVRNNGHTMYGWVEYKKSFDRGLTWGEPTVLDYSYKCFLEGVSFVGCEKAVVCDDGTIALFCLMNCGGNFEPYFSPVCLLSSDNGNSWSEPVSVSEERGRIYDAVYRDGKILALEFCNSTEKGFTCNEEGKFYKLFASDDNGKSFYEYSTLNFNTMGHAYGNMIFRPDGSLVFYGYNVKDEYNLTSLISLDNGLTWGEPFKISVAKIARNPQVAYLNGSYILHSRSKCPGHGGFVVYTSADGINWDEGTIVSETIEEGIYKGGYYSNNIVIKGEDGVERLLVQYSEDYCMPSGRVNIMHAFIEVK